MKIKVIRVFRDKYDRSVRYQPGTTVDIEDRERAEDIIARGLGEAVAERGNTRKSQSKTEE